MRDNRGDAPNGRPGPFRRTNGHSADCGVNGVPSADLAGGLFTRVLPDVDESAPVDLVAVQADDELVNALGARPAVPPERRPPPGPVEPGGSGADDRLMAMLAAWRAEIDAEPIPELIDLDAAVAAVTAGVQADELARRRRRAGRLRQLAPFAAAAAIIVATVTGVGLGSQDAMPGDTLWAVQKVVNPERAESVETKLVVESRLEAVRTALQEGDTVTAAQQLQAITTEIQDVRTQEGQSELAQEKEFLSAKLADLPPGAKADLSTPAKSNPSAHPTSAVPSPSKKSEEPSSTAPSGSASASESPSSEPDPSKQRERDKALVPVPPSAPGGSGSAVVPAPEVAKPQPRTTAAPDVTAPDSKPDPKPGNGEGGSDGTPAPSEPAPVPPPPSGDDGAAPVDGATTTAGTTTASGSRDDSAPATATDTTTS